MSNNNLELPNLYKTLETATQELTAFVSCAKGDERPIQSLVDAAEETLVDLKIILRRLKSEMK